MLVRVFLGSRRARDRARGGGCGGEAPREARIRAKEFAGREVPTLRDHNTT